MPYVYVYRTIRAADYEVYHALTKRTVTGSPLLSDGGNLFMGKIHASSLRATRPRRPTRATLTARKNGDNLLMAMTDLGGRSILIRK